MPFYLRKSLKVGPFRFNLSGSGIGMSVGAKGFRFGTGPHGHYIYTGRGGFYYKTWLRKQPSRSTALVPQFQSPELTPVPGVGPFIPVERGDLEQMIDADAESVLKQINKNRSLCPVWPFTAMVSLIVVFI